MYFPDFLWKMILNCESSRRLRLQGDRLYLTFPNPILLEHNNERRSEAEILRAGPLVR